MKTITKRIVDLSPDPANVRTHSTENIAAIAASLKRFGQQKPIVIDASGVVRAGNGTLAAAQSLGWESLSCVVSDLSGADMVAYAIADNRTAELAGWDEAALKASLDELAASAPESFASCGFDEAAMLELAGKADIEEDEIPEPPPEAITRRGDIITLGNHRVMCGDSTSAEDVARLLGGEPVSLLLMDPPYFNKIDADWDTDYDGRDGFLEWIGGVFALLIPLLSERGTVGCWCSPDCAWSIEGELRKHAVMFNHVVWTKPGTGAAKNIVDMRRWKPNSERLLLGERSHEPDSILSAFSQKTRHIAARNAYAELIERMRAYLRRASLKIGEVDAHLGTNGMAGHYFTPSQWTLPTREAWDKMRPMFAERGVDIGEFDAMRGEFDAARREFDAMGDVWVCQSPRGADRPNHPTPKPILLTAKIISAHSRDGDIAFDPFLGSGTTLIAAEQLGRVCFGMEIEPRYCDVSVARWEALTGRRAVRPVREPTAT